MNRRLVGVIGFATLCVATPSAFAQDAASILRAYQDAQRVIDAQNRENNQRLERTYREIERRESELQSKGPVFQPYGNPPSVYNAPLQNDKGIRSQDYLRDSGSGGGAGPALNHRYYRR